MRQWTGHRRLCSRSRPPPSAISLAPPVQLLHRAFFVQQFPQRDRWRSPRSSPVSTRPAWPAAVAATPPRPHQTGRAPPAAAAAPRHHPLRRPWCWFRNPRTSRLHICGQTNTVVGKRFRTTSYIISDASASLLSPFLVLVPEPEDVSPSYLQFHCTSVTRAAQIAAVLLSTLQSTCHTAVASATPAAAGALH